jgi:hypothetical protein
LSNADMVDHIVELVEAKADRLRTQRETDDAELAPAG